MEIISVTPRGYCQGVVRAIRIAQDTAASYPDTPITMLGMIVHNSFVVEECRKLGIRFVEDPEKTREELLDQIDEGIVIFTAHGVSDSVREKAERKGLRQCFPHTGVHALESPLEVRNLRGRSLHTRPMRTVSESTFRPGNRSACAAGGSAGCLCV